MSFFNKNISYTEQTTGIITGVSAVKVNMMHLPIAEYVVNGITYKIRVPYEIAIQMERQSNNTNQFVRSNLNFGTDVKGQMTKLQGCKVTIVYNSEKPKKAKVIGI